MPNPNKRSRRRERRRKVARKVAGKVLSNEKVQQVVSKGAGAVASVYGTPVAGMAVSKSIEKAMEFGGGKLSVPKTKRGKKAGKKAAKAIRKSAAKAAKPSPSYAAVIGAPPIGSSSGGSFGPKPGEVLEDLGDGLAVGDGGELYALPAPSEEAPKPFWMNPIYWAAVAGVGYFALRKKK